jgi:hypothetical protein
MPKPNYAFAKRQRDLAKKQKKEEKRLRKGAAASGSTESEREMPLAAVGDQAPKES